jgi:hypothetical protein
LSSDTDIVSAVALARRQVSGNQVRVPDPAPGEATVISRYGRERAVLIHPADFHRFDDFDQLLSEVSRLEPPALGHEAVRAHREEDTPGAPIVDPAVLDRLFG